MTHEIFWLVENSLFVHHYEWINGVKYFTNLYELRISFANISQIFIYEK